MAAATQAGVNHEDGVNIGPTTTAGKMTFWGGTPVARVAAAVTQATVTLTLTTGGVGFVSTAQAQAVVDQINAIRALLTAYNLWNGAA